MFELCNDQGLSRAPIGMESLYREESDCMDTADNGNRGCFLCSVEVDDPL